MKWIATLILLAGILVCTGCITPTGTETPPPSTTSVPPAGTVIPNLVGNWTGSTTSYLWEDGYREYHGDITMSVIEQEGRFFSGQVYFLLNGTKITKYFAGILSHDGKTFEAVEYPDGFCNGVILSADEIELIFRSDVAPVRIAFDTIKRSK